VNKETVEDIAPIGSKLWFEYHCNESPDSPDAPVWYHSHQKVTVLRVGDCDDIAFSTFIERANAGMPLVYKVKFNDELEWDVFEDELCLSRKDFDRPNPPKGPAIPQRG